jgi:hypothetical protein
MGISRALNLGCHARSTSADFEDHVWFEDWWMVASLCDE